MFVYVTSRASLLCILTRVVLSASIVPRDLMENAESKTKRESFDAVGFLVHYGYLQQPLSRHSGQFFQPDPHVIEAIRNFQMFAGLEVTGQIDKETMAKMKQPRCGFPDLPSGPQNTSVTSVATPQAFHTLGTRWMQDTVTWNAVQMSHRLSHRQQWRALARALRYWSDVTPLNFQRTTGHADIEVMFARGDHGDGFHNRFNGEGGVLAHAYQPGEGIGGDTHFDEDEQWSVGGGPGTDLQIVAAHEFGHALGLGHSSVPEALMAPYYRYTPDLQLHQDDVRGIQTLYGPRRRTPTSTTPVPPPPPPSSTTTAPTISTSETSTTTVAPTGPSYCGPDFTVDAVVNGEEPGVSYLFRGDRVFKVDQFGLQSGYDNPHRPGRPITQLFRGGPRRHVDAAVYLPESRTHLLFKGHQVWRFRDWHLEHDSPTEWLTFDRFLLLQRRGDLNLGPTYQDYLRLRPSAALTFTYKANVTKIYMFGDGLFWEWAEKTGAVVKGYPLQMARYWAGAPQHPQAATANRDNHFYFFKADRYFKLNNRISPSESRPIADWFGDDCGALYRPRSELQEQDPHQEDEEEGASLLGDASSEAPEKDTATEGVPVGTSHLSSDDLYRQRSAPLPFYFYLGPLASGHENERYVHGHH